MNKTINRTKKTESAESSIRSKNTALKLRFLQIFKLDLLINMYFNPF